MELLKTGTRVKIKKTSKYYGRHYLHNPNNEVTGTLELIENYTGRLPYRVDWDNGEVNVYGVDDLEAVPLQLTKKQKQDLLKRTIGYLNVKNVFIIGNHPYKTYSCKALGRGLLKVKKKKRSKINQDFFRDREVAVENYGKFLLKNYNEYFQEGIMTNVIPKSIPYGKLLPVRIEALTKFINETL